MLTPDEKKRARLQAVEDFGRQREFCDGCDQPISHGEGRMRFALSEFTPKGTQKITKSGLLHTTCPCICVACGKVIGSSDASVPGPQHKTCPVSKFSVGKPAPVVPVKVPPTPPAPAKPAPKKLRETYADVEVHDYGIRIARDKGQWHPKDCFGMWGITREGKLEACGFERLREAQVFLAECFALEKELDQKREEEWWDEQNNQI